MRSFLILLTGHAIEPVFSDFGDFDKMFFSQIASRKYAGQNFQVDTYTICDQWPNAAPRELKKYAGIFVSGSTSMLNENQEWMKASLKLMEKALCDQIPLFCVCFGHQLLGALCGARVGLNPHGRSNGTKTISLLKPNHLFGSLRNFDAQVSHRDVILEPSPHFEVIGKAEHDPHHIIKVGDNAFGVQFHPEWDINISRGYVVAKSSIIDQELGTGAAQKMLDGLSPSKQASLIINNFVELALGS